jgi:phosphonate transport system ATP-binding protein
VTKRYNHVAAVCGVDLAVHAGERVALVGPSGAGKSTLLSLLNASAAPDEGELRIFGRDPHTAGPDALRAIQRRIGTVHQQLHLVGPLRVIHNVNAGHLGRWSLGRALRSLVRPVEVERAAAWLARLGLAEKIFERTDRLSGGEQQRVALARVLVQDPAVILGDEPISSLDPENSRLVMDLLRELNERAGKTVVLSLHDVSYAFSHCERIVGLRAGRIAFDAPAAEVPRRLVDDLYRLER